jgi:hypothetical protein
MGDQGGQHKALESSAQCKGVMSVMAIFRQLTFGDNVNSVTVIDLQVSST